MSSKSSHRNVERLVLRVRQRADGRASVKVRTLLSAFGYSRRSPEIVRAVRDQLAAYGITVDFSVTSPPSLDQRIELVGSSRQESDTAPTAPSPERLEAAAVQDVPADVSDLSLQVPDPELPPPVIPREVLTNPDVVSSIGIESSGPEGEPPRSFAGRLFRAALGLFRRQPPISLRDQPDGSPDAPAQSPAGAAAAPAALPTDVQIEHARVAPSAESAAPASEPVGAAAIPVSASVDPVLTARAVRELSCVAEQTIRATVFVQVDEGHGSGFIVHPEGLVVTACHVLDGPAGMARKATIRLHDGRETTASLVRAHRPLDFALLWLDKPDHYPVLTVGDVSKARYAETVLAVGHPGIGGKRALTNTVSTGVIANPACSERGVDWIQMTTDIDPGNSGGPLVNRYGEVIGVNCWKFTRVAAAKMALPIDYLGEDLAVAAERGRDGYATGQVCSICGWYESDPDQWFCRTCGAAYPADSAAA